MKRKDCRPYVLHALAVTGGADIDWRNPAPPTWDGKRWHLARLKNEGDILHEVAHWICSPEEARALPNYGLGTDPDDGPETLPNVVPFVRLAGDKARRALLTLIRTDPLEAGRIIDEKTDREESLAAVVTIILMRRAGLPWAARARKTFGPAPGPHFWGLVAELSARWIDLDNPLAPFERAHEERTAAR